MAYMCTRYGGECEGCMECSTGKAVYTCEACGEDIYAGQRYYAIMGATYCDSCVSEDIAEPEEFEMEEAV